MTDTLRKEFEVTYRACFPIAAELQPNLFSFELDDDEYVEAKVHVAFMLWQAARTTAEQSTEALYTMDQMREFADNFYLSQLQILVAEKEAYERHTPKADRDSVIEECAKVCERIILEEGHSATGHGAYLCRKYIRALKSQQDAAIESRSGEGS